MRRSRVTANIVAAVVFAAVTIFSAYPVSASDQNAVGNGYFFTQTANQAGTGFAVRDAGQDGSGQTVRMWSEFQRFGAVDVLGYPISRPYRDGDGFIYQLFQRGLLQWHAEANAAVLANVLDQLSVAGADPWLASLGIPSPIHDDGSKGDFAAATQIRLGWLTEPHIRDWYLGTGAPAQAIARYGLPTSFPTRNGPFIVQRFQRIALQLWVDYAPGMPAPGSVVPVLAGDLFRQRALTQGIGSADARFLPETLTGQQTVATTPSAPGTFVDDGLRGALDLLAANPAGSAAAAALRSPGVQVVFGNVSAIALFTPGSLTVAINPQWRYSDPKLLATVLAHEGSHVNDYLHHVDMQSTAGCYNTELAAFQTQARVWADFYGPGGKRDPVNGLENEMDQILSQITSDLSGFHQTLISTYKEECGG